uniref:Uncharacterized protein n=1 Tax=Panagrolaimus superbus TaxID=310955 RepID=A0A914YED1_9BILA
MSADEPGPSQVKNIKAKFESATSTSTLNHPVNVEKTKRLFEKTTTPINSSNRFKPALKPKPKYLQQKN